MQVTRDGLHLRNVDGSSSAWEYHLPMQPFGNINRYLISNEIYQRLTQHTVGLTRWKVNNTLTITMKMVDNFINLFSDKTLKNVSFLYVKADFATTFPTT